MKTPIFTIIICAFVAFSCSDYMEGPAGPRGPQGNPGPQGEPGESGYVFEFSDINFTSGNGYSVLLEYPLDFPTETTDVAFAYLLWGTETVDGEVIDIWRPLPQQIIYSDGILQYNYDFSRYDVNLFLEANFPLDELGANETDDWIARVVVVPGDMWGTARISNPSYSELEDLLGLPDLNIDHSSYKVLQ